VRGQQSLSIIVRAEGTRGTMTALEPLLYRAALYEGLPGRTVPGGPECQPCYNTCPRWPSKPSG
jgi:hypothetical protein